MIGLLTDLATALGFRTLARQIGSYTKIPEVQDILVTDRFSAPLEVDRQLYDFEWDIPYYGVDKEMFPAPREVDREIY